MPKLYLLVKRKGTKRWPAAIPVKKGTPDQIKKRVLPFLKRGFTGKVVTAAQLKKARSR